MLSFLRSAPQHVVSYLEVFPSHPCTLAGKLGSTAAIWVTLNLQPCPGAHFAFKVHLWPQENLCSCSRMRPAVLGTFCLQIKLQPFPISNTRKTTRHLMCPLLSFFFIIFSTKNYSGVQIMFPSCLCVTCTWAYKYEQ